MENKIKKKKHIICNFLLILSLISVIGNFVVVLLLKNNKDLLIDRYKMTQDRYFRIIKGKNYKKQITEYLAKIKELKNNEK